MAEASAPGPQALWREAASAFVPAGEQVRFVARASPFEAAARRRAVLGAVVSGLVCAAASTLLVDRLPAGAALLRIVGGALAVGGLVLHVVGSRRPGRVAEGWLVLTDRAVRLHRSAAGLLRTLPGPAQDLPAIVALDVGDRRARATFADGTAVEVIVLRGSAALAAELAAHPLAAT